MPPLAEDSVCTRTPSVPCLIPRRGEVSLTLYSPYDVEDHGLLVRQQAIAPQENLAGGPVDPGHTRMELEPLPTLVGGAELPNAENVSEVDRRPPFADRPRFECVQRRTGRFTWVVRPWS